MKRRITAIFIAMMMVAMAAGCGQTPAQDAADGTTVESTEAEDTADETDAAAEDTAGSEEAEAAEPESALPASEKESVPGFTVNGTMLLDANGNEFVMRGINHPHSWFAAQDITAIPAIAATGSNTIRIVCSNGLQYQKDSQQTLEALIAACRANELIAVLEIHDGTGDDKQETLQGMADYWIEMRDALIGNEDVVILNIANEWMGSWDSKGWRDGYTTVIPQLREAGIQNTIMVDAGGWGQYGKSIEDYGSEVFASDPLQNTMFSVHMYGTAGKNADTISSNIEGATDQNLCIIVGEFGYTHSDGDVDEEYIMQYCTENRIGYLGWSWKGNGGGVEYLDIATQWDGSELSADWGENLIHGEYGIMATSEKCSIFE